MVTDQDLRDLKHRLILLEGQVAFLYKHLGVTFEPETQVTDDARILEALQKGKILDAIKIHRELTGSSLEEAKAAIEDAQARLGM